MSTKTDRDTDRRTKGLLTLDPVEELALTFSPGPDGDFVVTAASSEGEAQGGFRPPWSDRRLKTLYRWCGRAARNARPASTETEPDWDPWREGRRLHDALFATPALRDLFEATRAVSRSRHFRLRLVLDPDQPAARMLHTIPWELIFWRDRSEVTSLAEGSSVVRSLMVRGQPRHFEARRRLRVLMISSGARDLDLETERRRIEEAAGATRRLEVRAERATGLAPLERLLETARADGRPFHGLHLAGHGDLDPELAGGSLRWEMPDGSTLELPGRGLATLLRAHPSVQLVVLNACHTGELPDGAGDPFSGVASALLQAGVPAVVAIQGEIEDDEAILFAGVFYSRLAEGDLPEAAMARARHALFLKGPERREWLKPILFLATPRPRIPRHLVRVAATLLGTLVLGIVLLLLAVRYQHDRAEAQAVETAIERVENGRADAVSLLQAGRPGAALTEIDRVIATLDPSVVSNGVQAAVYATAGTAEHATGDLRKAIERTREAIRLDPDFGFYHTQLGVLLRRMGRDDEAVDSFRRAIEKDPDSVEARRALGDVLIELHRPDEALEVIAGGLDRRPEDGLLHLSAGWAHHLLGDAEDAAQAFRLALKRLPWTEIEPRAEAAFGLVAVAVASGGPDEIRSALARFRLEDPEGITEHADEASRLEASFELDPSTVEGVPARAEDVAEPTIRENAARSGLERGASEPVIAYVTDVDGRVTAEGTGGAVLELHRRQVVSGGQRLFVPAPGVLKMVCSNDRSVEMEGLRSGLFVESACSEGRPLPVGTYPSLVEDRFVLVTVWVHGKSLLLLSAPFRGSEEGDPLVPTLLDPRETVVLERRPPIRWTPVRHAVEYEVELVGETRWKLTFDSDDVPCTIEEYPTGRLEVCTVPWPEDQPGLSPGEDVFLRVGARTGLVTPLRAGEARKLTLVAEATGREILRARQVMSELATEDRALREAVLLANGGLLGEAARVLREDLIERPSSEGFLLLGAIDLDRKLPSAAIRSFHTALALASEGPPSREPDISRLAREGIEAAKLSLSSPRDP